MTRKKKNSKPNKCLSDHSTVRFVDQQSEHNPRQEMMIASQMASHRASMPEYQSNRALLTTDTGSNKSDERNNTLQEGILALDKILNNRETADEDDFDLLVKLKDSLMNGEYSNREEDDIIPESPKKNKFPPKPKNGFGGGPSKNMMRKFDPKTESMTSTICVLSHFGGLLVKQESIRSTSSQSANERMHASERMYRSRQSLGIALNPRSRNTDSNHRLKLNKLKSRRLSSLLSTKQSDAPDEWYNLPRESQVKLANLLSWKSLSKWEFDVFQIAKLTKNRPLLFIGWAILSSPYAQHVMEEVILDKNEKRPVIFERMDGYWFIDHFDIKQNKMINFLREMEKHYHSENPYHNNIHAADVVQSTHSLFEGLGGIEVLQPTKIQLFSVLISAVVHDVGHPGLNNEFQKKTLSKLALRYNDQSVLENMHAAVAMDKLFGEKKIDSIDIFKNMKKTDAVECRTLIIEAVLGTDMSKHFDHVNEIKDLIASSINENQKMNSKTRWGIMHYMMHLADISNGSKVKRIAVQWTDRCLEEFFNQGDKEKTLNLPVSPLCDRDTVSRPESQSGFIEFIIKPAFEVLGDLLPKIQQEIMPILEDNLAYWKTQMKQKEIDDMDNIRKSLRLSDLSAISLQSFESDSFDESDRFDEEEEEETDIQQSSPFQSSFHRSSPLTPIKDLVEEDDEDNIGSSNNIKSAGALLSEVIKEYSSSEEYFSDSEAEYEC